MTPSVSLMLAIRYMRMAKPRTWKLFLIPLVPFLQLLVLRAVEILIAHNQLAERVPPGISRPVLLTYAGLLGVVLLFSVWYWHALLGEAGRWWSERKDVRWVVLGLRPLTALVLGVLAGPGGVAYGLATLISFALVRPRSMPVVLRVGLPLFFVLFMLVTPIALAICAHDPRVLSVHADLARGLGFAAWGLGVATVLLFAVVLALRYLSIFATISTVGMFLGCAALVLVLSVMSGFESDIKRKILGTHAHVIVTRPDEAFLDWEKRLAQVAHTPGVVAVTPFLSGEAMISSSANRSNVVVKGIDPNTVGQVTDLSRNMEVGDLASLANPLLILPADDPSNDPDLKPGGAHPPPPAPHRSPPGIVLGRELAKSLRVYLGDDVSLVSPTGGIGPSGAVPKARPYRVAGIFYSGMFEYDSKFVYLTLGSAQKLFDQADEVTGLEVKVPNADRTDEMVATLSASLGKAYEVNDWKSLNRSLFSALVLEKIVMFVFLSFIILVAAFSIIANGQMIASQKIGELAILKSMGATNGTVATAFFLVGALLGVVGVLAGVACGIGGALALRHWGAALDPEVFYLTQLPVRMDVREILVVCGAGLLVTIAATVHPAWLAARMQPVDALREGGH